MKKITVLDIKFYPHTVRWYRRKKSKQDSTQVSCYDGFAHIETVDGMRTAHVRVICDPTEKPDKVCTIHMARAYDISQQSAKDVQMAASECVLQEGWVVTAPQDLEQEQYDNFFLAVYDFLENRYGEENVVQAVVHDDEGGQPHLHFCFVPVVEDKKHEEGYKVCANDVLDRRELRNFHPDLQRYLDEHGLEDAHVMTGVTRAQGGNRTVAELKAEREQEYEQETERPELDFGGPRVEQELHF